MFIIILTKHCFACGSLISPIGDLDASTIGIRHFKKKMLSELQRAKKQECEEAWVLL